MKKNVRAIAINDIEVFLTSKVHGPSYGKKMILEGEEINLPVVSDEKIASETIKAILGERNVIFAEGDHFISVYSNDFEFHKA